MPSSAGSPARGRATTSDHRLARRSGRVTNPWTLGLRGGHGEQLAAKLLDLVPSWPRTRSELLAAVNILPELDHQRSISSGFIPSTSALRGGGATGRSATRASGTPRCPNALRHRLRSDPAPRWASCWRGGISSRRGRPRRLGHLVGVEQHLAVDVRAARPIVSTSGVLPRRKLPCRRRSTATSETSGRTSPSRSRSRRPARRTRRAQLADDLDSLERVDLRVRVARLHARLEQVVGQVHRHFLVSVVRSSAAVLAAPDLVQQVVDLVLVARSSTSGSTMKVGRISCSATTFEWRARTGPGVAKTKTSCGTSWRNSSKRSSRLSSAEEAKAEDDQRLLARAIALVHAAELRDGWCDSSTKTTRSSGKRTNSVNRCEPCGRPSRWRE